MGGHRVLIIAFLLLLVTATPSQAMESCQTNCTSEDWDEDQADSNKTAASEGAGKSDDAGKPDDAGKSNDAHASDSTANDSEDSEQVRADDVVGLGAGDAGPCIPIGYSIYSPGTIQIDPYGCIDDRVDYLVGKVPLV